MASVLVPVLYVVVVFGSLLLFSSYYRRRNASIPYDPYFPQHRERDIYVSLLQKSDPPTPDALLKAALVRRAMTDVSRILRLREDKPALQALLQKGSIGDDLWNSFLAAEKELEAEILEVVGEANTFVEGWGSVIFQTATEMMHNERMRVLFEHLPAMRAEKEMKYGKTTPLKPSIQGNLAPPSAAPPVPATPSGVPLPATPAPPPETPVSAKSNGLAPPSAGAESAFGEGESPMSPMSPSSPRSPSKSAAKKGKKRK